MIHTGVLILLAILGVSGSLASTCLLLWSMHQNAKLRLDQNNAIRPNDPATDNRFRQLQQALRRNYLWVSVGLTVVILISLFLMLLLSTTEEEINTLTIYLGCISGAWFPMILATVLCCNRNQNSARQFLMIRSIGIFHLLVAFLALSFYSIATLHGDNPAFDESSYYHGPAPILDYEGENLNYDNVARGAIITVGYGGSWACPSNDGDDWCEQDLELAWCDIYDKTGYWSYNNIDPTWKEWEGEDLWEASSFSCAKGMANTQDDDNENGDENDDEDNNQQLQQYLNDPFDAPSQINIFADCDSCQMVIDDPIFRSKFYHVSSFLYLLLVSGICAVAFLGLAGIIHWRNHHYKQESTTLKKTAGVDLLPAVPEEESNEASGVAA